MADTEDVKWSLKSAGHSCDITTGRSWVECSDVQAHCVLSRNYRLSSPREPANHSTSRIYSGVWKVAEYYASQVKPDGEKNKDFSST
jgi:hypothetical protein